MSYENIYISLLKAEQPSSFVWLKLREQCCTAVHEDLFVQIQSLSKRFEHLLLWPPRSPDLTPCDFFLWGYVKDNTYKPPLPQNGCELQDRIRAALQTIDGNMLKRVWQETLSY